MICATAADDLKMSHAQQAAATRSTCLSQPRTALCGAA
jgi:hypothetical protein